MRYTVVFSSRAGKHLDSLYRMITAEAGEARADKFVGSVVDYCLGFDMFPERGTRREDLSAGLRIVGFKRVMSIAFRIEGDRVQILGAYYRGRNYETDLKDDIRDDEEP